LFNLSPALLFAGAVALALLVERLLRALLLKKVREKLIADAAVLVLISLALFGVGWELSNLYKNWAERELLRNLTILTSALYLTRAVHLLTGRRGKLTILPYLFFLLAFGASVLFIYPPSPLKNATLLKWILFLKKLFIYLGALTVALELSHTFKREGVAKAFRLTSFVVLTAITLLWELDYLKFDFHSLIGIALLVFLTVLYTIAHSKLLPRLTQTLLKELPPKDVEVVERNLKYLLTVFYLILSVKTLEAFSNLSKLFKKIDSFYLIKTELVKISVGNIVDFALTAVVLFSILNIAKKLIKLSFPKERREVEGGSAEALIFNLGVLFNSIVLLSTLGITWKVILPIAGTLGVGIGFGLQTIMNNYVSGFILLFSKKLKVGDIVELPSISVSTLGSPQPSVFGKVEDIGILSTIVRTNDGVEISIPNSSFISSPIVNFSLKDPFVRLKIPVGVSYFSDPLTVKKVLEEVIEELPYAVKHLPKAVRFEELGDSALIFKAIFWIDIRKDLWVRNVVSDFYYKAWYRLKEAGIEIPFPQQDVWFRNKLKVEIENLKGGRVDKGNS